MYSRMRAAGFPHGIENRRVMCGSIWLPSPSANRPPESRCRSHAVCATVIGERANAIATLVPIRSGVPAAHASVDVTNGSCCSSAIPSPSNPPASAERTAATTSAGGPAKVASNRIRLILPDDGRQDPDCRLRSPTVLANDATSLGMSGISARCISSVQRGVTTSSPSAPTTAPPIAK